MQVAQNPIKFLSTLSEDQVKRFGIQEKVIVASWARKLIGKYRMLDSVQAKVDIIIHKIKEVADLFNPIVNRGIPFFWEEKGPVLSQQEYLDKLVKCRLDHNKFEDMQHALSGKIVFDKLTGEFELLFDFEVTCTKVPDLSYIDNMELRVLEHEIVIVDLLNSEHWRSIQQYGSTKFKLQP